MWRSSATNIGDGFDFVLVGQRRRSKLALHVIAGFEDFGVNDRERRDFGVPFQQRRDAAGELVGLAVELPNGIDDVAIVGVEQVGVAIGMARQMHLHDAMVRKILNVFVRVEVVVHAGDIDVVDVEQQAAIGFVGQRG